MYKLFFGLFFIFSTTYSQTTPAKEVINNYLKAIGGIEKITLIKDISIEIEIRKDTTEKVVLDEDEIDGSPQCVVISIKKAPVGKMKEIVVFEGVGEVSKIVLNGDIAKIRRGEDEKPVEFEMFDLIRSRARIVEEEGYLTNRSLELHPNETIDGEECHVISISLSKHEKRKEYYSISTSLKKRMDQEIEGMTFVTSFFDYKEFEPGIKFSMLQKTQSTDIFDRVVIKSIIINEGIDESEFAIDKN